MDISVHRSVDLEGTIPFDNNPEGWARFCAHSMILRLGVSAFFSPVRRRVAQTGQGVSARTV